jgi:hypothetical protein
MPLINSLIRGAPLNATTYGVASTTNMTLNEILMFECTEESSASSSHQTCSNFEIFTHAGSNYTFRTIIEVKTSLGAPPHYYRAVNLFHRHVSRFEVKGSFE